MSVPKGSCQAQIKLTAFNTSTGATTIRYFAPFPTAITGVISATGTTSTIATLQAQFDADATLIASGYTIIVTGFDSTGLTVEIRKQSTSQISTIASGRVSDGDLVTASFVCNFRKGKKTVGALPSAFQQDTYFNISVFPEGIPKTLPYNGINYVFNGIVNSPDGSELVKFSNPSVGRAGSQMVEPPIKATERVSGGGSGNHRVSGGGSGNH